MIVWRSVLISRKACAVNACQRALSGLLVSAIAGCTVLPHEPDTDRTTLLLQRQLHIRHGTSNDIATALTDARARLLAQPELANRVELALLLTLPGASAEQSHEAMELLKACDSPIPNDPAVALCAITGGLLDKAFAAEQKVHTLEEDAKESERRALELQRQLGALYAQSAAKLESEAQKRLRVLERQIAEQRTQLEGMRQQLQELQNIERSIETRRETPVEGSRKP